MLSKDDILAALAAVPGPDGKTPLNQSGAIDGVTIRDGKVFVAEFPPKPSNEFWNEANAFGRLIVYSLR